MQGFIEVVVQNCLGDMKLIEKGHFDEDIFFTEIGSLVVTQFLSIFM